MVRSTGRAGGIQNGGDRTRKRKKTQFVDRSAKARYVAGAELHLREIKDFYDTVVVVPSFDVLRKEGWEIKRDTEDEEGTVGATRLAILGNSKRGKTWFLSKLCGIQLNQNEVFHTPGLCSKNLLIKGKRVSLLDTKGDNSPLSSVDKEAFQDRKAEESFVREVACDISDAFIYVVGQVGSDEQLKLMQLLSEVVNNKRVSFIFVVHNLRHLVSPQEYSQAWDEIVALYSNPGTPQATKLKEFMVHGVSVWYLQGELMRGSSKLTTFHFMLGREGTHAGENNDNVLECIRDTISGPGLPQFQHERQFLVELQRAMQAKVGMYYQNGSPASQREGSTSSQDVQVDISSRRIRVLNADHLKLREMDIGTFVNKLSDTEFARYSIKDTADRQLKVEIVLPGFNPKHHKGVIDMEYSNQGPKIIIDPKATSEALPDGTSERVLQSQNYPPSLDEKYTIQLPRKVRGSARHAGDPKHPVHISENFGIVTLIWDLLDDQSRPISWTDFQPQEVT